MCSITFHLLTDRYPLTHTHTVTHTLTVPAHPHTHASPFTPQRVSMWEHRPCDTCVSSSVAQLGFCRVNSSCPVLGQYPASGGPIYTPSVDPRCRGPLPWAPCMGPCWAPVLTFVRKALPSQINQPQSRQRGGSWRELHFCTAQAQKLEN